MAHRAGALVIAASMLSGRSAQSDRLVTSPTAGQVGSQATPFRVMVLTATRGFRHDSIGAAREVLSAMSSTTGEFTLTVTEDVSAVTAAALANYEVLCFVLTTGEAAVRTWTRKSAIGIWSSGQGVDRHPQRNRHTRMNGRTTAVSSAGGLSAEHPWTQSATVLVEDQTHPATAGLGERFSIMEEFYTFRENPRGVQVLLRLDPASVGSSGDYPLAWAQSYGGGRAYYNALGHFEATWRDPRFQRQVLGALRWAARR